MAMDPAYTFTPPHHAISSTTSTALVALLILSIIRIAASELHSELASPPRKLPSS
ncbi:hypothetical protein M405DRAFT_857261 [Rhizopogon salebrosus TDB-379]|nr:hypothetical protein M405DRAFT_857261 [Rhizopogon salebrosus TDB-379]